VDGKREIVSRSPELHGISRTPWTVHRISRTPWTVHRYLNLYSRPTPELQNKISTSLCSSNTVVCFRISTESFWMRHLMVLFDKRIIAKLLPTASLHIILAGYFHGCWFDHALSRCIRRFCSCIFPSNRKRSKHWHCFAIGVSFYSRNRWTITTTSRYLVFILFRKLKVFVKVFYMFLLVSCFFERSVNKGF